MNFLSTPRRISVALGISRFLKMFMGLVVLYLSVKYFGTTFQRDSWVLSVGLYGIILVFLYSPINETFRTKYIFLKEKGDEKSAMKSVNSLMNLFSLSFLFVAISLFLFKDYITHILAPGFDSSQCGFLSWMILSLIPYFILQQQGNILVALLNTYDSYFYPEFVSLLSSVINILFIVFLSDTLGIYSLVVATTLNGLILVSFLTFMLRRKVKFFRLISFESLSFSKPFVAFSVPMYLSTFCNQMYILVEKSSCTRFGEGAVSVFDYARQITSLPHVVFSSIIPIVMTPLLSRYFINGDENSFSDELRRFIRLLFYFTIIVAVLMQTNGEQISYLLFSEKNVQFVSIIAYLGISIVLLVFVMICGQAMIARERVIDYAVSVAIGNVVSIGLCLGLVRYCSLEYIALFYLVGQSISALILFYRMQIKRKWLMLRDVLSMVVFFIVSCGLLMVLQMMLRDTILCSQDRLYALFDLMICGVAVFFIFLCFLLLFGQEDRKALYNLFLGKFKHKK